MRPKSAMSVMVCGVLTKDAQVKTFEDGNVSAWLFVDCEEERGIKHVERVTIDFRLGKKPSDAELEFANKLLRKGARILVPTGHVRAQPYLDSEGNPKASLKVFTRTVRLLDAAPRQPDAETQGSAPPEAPPQERSLRSVPVAAAPVPVAPAVPTAPAPAAAVHAPPPARTYDDVPFDDLAMWDN